MSKIAVTGTPGTGKTTLAKLLAVRLKMKYIELNPILIEDFGIEYDDDMESWEVDIDRAVRKLDFCDNCILDSHLSHEFDVDKIVVVRCEPYQLALRLAKRGWSSPKVIENAEAEGLNVVSDEAWATGRKVVEIDTTSAKPDESADQAVRLLRSRKPGPRFDFVDRLPISMKHI